MLPLNVKKPGPLVFADPNDGIHHVNRIRCYIPVIEDVASKDEGFGAQLFQMLDDVIKRNGMVIFYLGSGFPDAVVVPDVPICRDQN